MEQIKIQVFADRKVSKNLVNIGNMLESGVTKLVFELDEDIVTLDGNVYLFVSYDGKTYPYPLTDYTFEVGRELTQRKKNLANVVVSTSDDLKEPLKDVVWISNTITLKTDTTSIDMDAINEKELPPSLEIVYDDLLALEKRVQEKIDQMADYRSEGEGSFAENDSSTAFGDYSHAEGKGTITNGAHAHVEGLNTVANGHNSHAEGDNTQSSGQSSHAEGIDTITEGPYSHAEGNGTTASGKNSHAEGHNTVSQGESSHSEGYLTKSLGTNSHAEGIESIARGESSHAEGNGTYAGGSYSHAEGFCAETADIYTHAEGNHTRANKENSHAEGFKTESNGYNSHAEGGETIAQGHSSHSEGCLTKSRGPYSHAEGFGTDASANSQHVQGKWNIVDADYKYAHIVGNGTADTNRINIHTVDWQGNAWFQGTVASNGADYAEYFEWEDGNQDNEDRVGLLVALNGEYIRPANSNDEILGAISGTAAILGDNYECEWNGKYEKDEFGRIIYEMVEEFADITVDFDKETREAITEKKSLGFFKHPKLNPNYNPDETYINRSERKEWDTVGMLGKLFVRDDGTCQVNGYVTVGHDGIATRSEDKTNMRVLSRVNEGIVRVLLK